MPAEKADSIGDDRININNMWITDNYLNINTSYTTATAMIKNIC